MGLTPEERKERLKSVARRPAKWLAPIAKRTRRANGHVSQVISGLRPDPRVEKEVARRFGLPVEVAFPEYHGKAASRVND